MGALGLGCHVVDVEDLAVAVDERDRQRNERVLHPEAEWLRARKHEDHPVVLTQAEAVHQPERPRLDGVGHLRRDVVARDLQRNGAERWILRRRRRRAARDRRAEGDEGEQRAKASDTNHVIDFSGLRRRKEAHAMKLASVNTAMPSARVCKESARKGAITAASKAPSANCTKPWSDDASPRVAGNRS